MNAITKLLTKNIWASALSVLVIALAFSLVLSPKAHALNSSSWNAGHIIDDVIFTDDNSMTVQQIQNFLNSEVPNCDTNGTMASDHPNGQGGFYTDGQWGTMHGNPPPFTCLKNYVENTSTLANNFTNPGQPVPGGISAAQIIWNAGQQYQINPQVILATMQKEQGLVTDYWPWYGEYTCAMGYFSCSKDSDFFQQVDGAAWQFRHYLQNPGAYNYWIGQNYIQYNPNSSCGGSVVNIANGATAALYIYTPYQPNSAALSKVTDSSDGGTGDSCSSYGNRNFWWYFNEWFGSSLAQANNYAFVTSSATQLNFNPGNTGSVTVVLENTGLNTWYSDNNLPAGQVPTRLATISYQNSPFIVPDTNSLNTQNQVLMTPDVVAPGQNATFTFDTVGPYKVMTDNIYLVPIVGGAFLQNMGIDVVLKANPPSWQLVSSSIGTQSPLPNQVTEATFTVLNNSYGTWYSDHNTPAGQNPTRLSTIGYQNSPFADTNDPNWLGTSSQIEMTPDVVAPGQDATFTAEFAGPINSKATTAAFHFFITVGGVFTNDMGCTFNLSTPAANFGYKFISSTPMPSVMSPGQQSPVTVTVQNTGNILWQDETIDNRLRAFRLMFNQPNYRNSAFYDANDSNWLSPSQIAKNSGPTLPGGNATFTFTWLAPAQTGNYHEPFSFEVAGNFMHDLGTAFNTTVQ